jgi:tRNA threonylcarbamoyladenosine biosynthesis protein TsaE
MARAGESPGYTSRIFLSCSTEATEELGAAIARLAPPGLVLVLEGELGAGKTCFVRGFARGLEVVEPVTSPTFSLMNEYEGRLPLLHFDAWMEGRERSFLADGGADQLGQEAIALIEWGERVDEWLPRPFLRLKLSHRREPETRRIEVGIIGPSEGLEALVTALRPMQGLLEGEEAG